MNPPTRGERETVLIEANEDDEHNPLREREAIRLLHLKGWGLGLRIGVCGRRT